jgi:glycerophosphoryl diester phosphodiesterase
MAFMKTRSIRIKVVQTSMAACLVLTAPLLVQGAATVWNFNNPADPLTPSSGTGQLGYYDPDNTGWGPTQTQFGKASAFGLPPMPSGDPDVMWFPACTARQGYRMAHAGGPNGPYGDTLGRVSNYTLILDVLYPAESDGRWRALYQTDTNNASDAEFYVQNVPGGGIGIINVYNGAVASNTWHRLAIVMRSAPGEGACQRFIDGRFVGGIGSTGSGLELRWALSDVLLLFTDDNGETAPGFVSSVLFVDRPMTMGEIAALGGPHVAGADTAGAPAPPLTQQMPRRVGVIGHRGGFFCCAPDNTLAAVRRAVSNNVPVIEIDTRLSADGVCVLMHDSTVDRTTDGTGSVASMTVQQLKQLDAGSWFGPEFAGETVPILDEVMEIARDKMILYFDLKVTGQINAIMNSIAETDFNPDDCWFWVYDNTSDAASIRARLPNAKIIWSDPASTWATDPNYFSNLRNIGVYGFDLGVYYGTVNTAFTRTAKAQGFMIAIYTILDPDTMVRNAAAGVDYMETDFPHIMQQIQPPQTGPASGPFPADQAVGVPPNVTLTWVVGSNAIAHRVYLGTNDPPVFLGEQSYDLVPLSNLLAGVTYHWRIDEVTPTSVVTGQVWGFTVTQAVLPSSVVYEWNFDQSDLSAALGPGIMTYADNVTVALTQFGETDGTTIPHIGGEPARYMHVPAFSDLGNGYHLSFNASGPNGNGAYINQFTFIIDLLIPGSLDWTPIFNTNPENGNDADFYVAGDGSVGIAVLGYSSAGLITPSTWSRIAFVADLGPGLVNYYVDGMPALQRTGASLLDGRFSLYSNVDPGPDLLLFNEGDTGGAYTHELYASSVAFVDRVLSAAEIAALGRARADGIFVQRLRISLDWDTIQLRWQAGPSIRLQRSSSLSPPTWHDVPDTLGTNSYSEPVSGGMSFYRLLGQ